MIFGFFWGGSVVYKVVVGGGGIWVVCFIRWGGVGVSVVCCVKGGGLCVFYRGGGHWGVAKNARATANTHTCNINETSSLFTCVDSATASPPTPKPAITELTCVQMYVRIIVID